MKKSNKILSLLLAFAMVFSVVVPAFANGTGKTTVPAKSITFKVKVKDGKDGSSLDFAKDTALDKFVLYKENGDSWTEVNNGIASKEFVQNAEESYNLVSLAELNTKTSYKLVVNELTSKLVETTDGVKGNGFEFYVDEYGNVKTSKDGETIDLAKKVYTMVYETKQGTEAKFRIRSLNEEGKAIPNVKFSFVNLENDGTDYKVTETGAYKKGTPIADSAVVTDPKKLVTDDAGMFKLTDDELGKLISATTPVGKENKKQQIVGIVVNGQLVAVVELTNIKTRDDVPEIKLYEPAEASLLKVYVKGYANKVDLKNRKAPKALKDAAVKILQNETKYQGEVKFGKVLAETKTNEDGYAEIKNPQKVGAQIKILESDSSAKGIKGYYTDIVLYNKVTVSLAGYMTREFKFDKENTVIEFKDGVYTIETTLYPEGTEFTNRISGPKRYDTSVEVARKAFPNLKEVHNIVIASGDNFADGLAAASLSGFLKAPVVLNGRGGAEKSVAQFVKDVNKLNRDGKANIVLVGGETYLSGALTRELEALGNKVSRIYGANRYETSAKVFSHIEKYYKEKVEANGSKFYEPFIASGENFADALVASVPSALQGRPILLVAKNSVDPSVKAILDSKKVENAIVVGGTSSVSDKALAQISARTERLSGNNRQLTSMKLAGRFFMNAGEAIVVDGSDFADALVAAQYGAKINAPVLLTASKTVLGKDLAQYLRDNHMTQITIVGGTGSVSQGIEKELAKVLGGAEIK